MKEIVVISGKGGTGKTSITASFAYLAEKNIVIADCDVDAADMHLLLKPEIIRRENFYSSLEAHIDHDVCIACNKCLEICRFDAISENNNVYDVIHLNCEGCAYCEKICPVEAISMKRRLDGEWFISNTRIQKPMVHAKLGIGTENSGKLVATVKNIAHQIAEMYNKEYILVDGSPGVGCPVISSLSGASFVVLVTEPTVSGIHDLQRVFSLIKKFGIPAGIIINKFDLNINKYLEIMNFANKNNITSIAEIPYDETFVLAQTQGITMAEYENSNIKNILSEAWNKIISIVN
jgi:MinD superfamily P-loop ATPase